MLSSRIAKNILGVSLLIGSGIFTGCGDNDQKKLNELRSGKPDKLVQHYSNGKLVFAGIADVTILYPDQPLYMERKDIQDNGSSALISADTPPNVYIFKDVCQASAEIRVPVQDTIITKLNSLPSCDELRAQVQNANRALRP